MPGLLKVGVTERTPRSRLEEANKSDTWRPPTPYKIEFAKKVSNAFEKEKILHTLLEKYTERVNKRREFFRVSLEEVCKFFDLMDGEIWKEDMDTELKYSFQAFISDNFVLEPKAGPISFKTVCDVYNDWKRVQIGMCVLKPKQLANMLKPICDEHSTEDEFWGIRPIMEE